MAANCMAKNILYWDFFFAFAFIFWSLAFLLNITIALKWEQYKIMRQIIHYLHQMWGCNLWLISYACKVILCSKWNFWWHVILRYRDELLRRLNVRSLRWKYEWILYMIEKRKMREMLSPFQWIKSFIFIFCLICTLISQKCNYVPKYIVIYHGN